MGLDDAFGHEHRSTPNLESRGAKDVGASERVGQLAEEYANSPTSLVHDRQETLAKINTS